MNVFMTGQFTLNGDIKIRLNNAVLKGCWGSSVNTVYK